MKEPLLSIVVIGRNEGARLVRCLESIGACNLPAESTELIYVDSNSSDGSPERAAEGGARVIVLTTGKLTAARARNAGWRAANASLIFFLDGDTILDPFFIDRARAEFHDPNVVVVCGHRREIQPNASIFQRVLDLEWMGATGLTNSCGGDAVMRRSALERADGYDPDLIAGEEPDLCRRLRAAGGLILRIDAPMTGHDLAITRWSQYWRHAKRTGHAYAEVSCRYESGADPLWRRESRRNLLHGPLVLLAPLIAIAAAVGLNSWLIMQLSLSAALLILIRTAWRARWRSDSKVTLFLFAIHSHIQQVPIFWGQISYRWASMRKRQSKLIEYKSGIS